MAKDILFNRSAIDKLIKGLDTAVEAVAGTVGPKGRNAYIFDQITPKVTNDGVTIANYIHLKDPQEDLGAYTVRNITSQTNDDVGDGTTTTAILLQALVHECLARPENPMLVKDSLTEAGDKVLKLLHKKSVKVKKEEIESVALISAENAQLAKMIAEIIKKLGEKAVINVEDSKTLLTDYEIVDGYEASVGYMSPHFVNDKKSGKAIYIDVPILVTDKKISNVAEIAPLFDKLAKQKIGSCVIVCDDIDDSMLGMLVVNKNLGTFQSLVIKTSGETLKDIAGAVGATMISSSTGITWQTVEVDHLGIAKKVVCDANKTLFIGNGEDSKKYANELERTLENEPNMYLKRKLEERIARLRGGIAILRVAAPSDLEREYLKMKAEDAVKAVQAALEEGIVEGGGMAFWRIAQELQPKTIGEQVLKKALVSPLKKIVENCGVEYAEVIKNLPDNQGYNAKTDKYVNMKEVGIMDPTKVERLALLNAISAASTLCTTFCLITEHPIKK